MPAISYQNPDVAQDTTQARPIRVVHVVGQLAMGGMEKLLVEFARHTDAGRFALHFVSLGEDGPPGQEIRDLGCPVTILRSKQGLRPGLIFRLRGLFRELSADVVHTHNTHALCYAGPAARLAAVKSVIHTRHGQEFQVDWSRRQALRLAALTADRVVCVSRDSCQLAQRQGIACSRLITLHNGIDLQRFHQARVRKNGLAVAVGRLSPEKDFATLIKAAAIVSQAEPTFRLVIAGDGPCRADLQALVNELRLGESVQLLGEIRDVPALLAKASLFVNSSLSEGVSLTLLEAMASSLPIVATAVGGNPEVVADEETGILVPPADPAALARAILQLWRQPQLRKNLGTAGRQRAEQHFCIQRMIAAYERLYLETLGRC